MHAIRNVCAGVLIASCCSAQVPQPWDVDVTHPVSVTVEYWDGETVSLRPAFYAGGSSVKLAGTEASLLWQTNGMGTNWWSKGASIVTGSPDRVHADFSPTNSPGTSCSFFIRLRSSNGSEMYRAKGQIKNLSSPGTNPNMMPPPSAWNDLSDNLLALMIPSLPTYAAWTNEAAARAAADLAISQRIDALDETAVLDEAALRISADAAGSNHVSAVAANLQTQLTAIASFTGIVGRASSSDSALRLISSDSNWWVSVSSGTATLWRVTATNRWIVTATGTPITNGAWDVVNPPTLFTNAGRWSVNCPGKDAYVTNSVYALSVTITVPWNNYYASQATSNLTFYSLTSGVGTSGTVTIHRVSSITNNCGSYITQDALAAGISNALASYNPAAATNALALASNAWQQAILAQSQISAATNALVQTYLLNSNAWITANWSNQTLTVSLVQTNGTTNVVSVGGNAIDPQATNLLWIALNQSISSIAGKADKAWGTYAPDGTANPDPAYMLWLNKPATLFASGCSWETYGTYAVLLSTGTVAFASGTNGAFRVGPDSTNYFGYVQGGSVTVGAVADSINVVNGGQAGGYAEITYLYAGGDFPVIWFTPSLGVDFTQLTGVWINNLDGTATVTVPAESAGGFYKATTSATFSNYFLSTMPARFAGGVVGNTNDLPVVFNSVLTITNGGHTYKLPAQRVN